MSFIRGSTLLPSIVLTVSFEEPTYSVVEAEGPVEVCVILNCEAAENVTVTATVGAADPEEATGKNNKCVSE